METQPGVQNQRFAIRRFLLQYGRNEIFGSGRITARNTQARESHAGGHSLRAGPVSVYDLEEYGLGAIARVMLDVQVRKPKTKYMIVRRLFDKSAKLALCN